LVVHFPRQRRLKIYSLHITHTLFMGRNIHLCYQQIVFYN
jgi:hypothetical protein